jgi:hypothetical protein
MSNGTWYVGCDGQSGTIFSAPPERKLIAYLPANEHERSHARLIAAAPALLNECRETLKDLETWDGSPEALEIICINLRAAIAKGET